MVEDLIRPSKVVTSIVTPPNDYSFLDTVIFEFLLVSISNNSSNFILSDSIGKPKKIL